MSVSLGFKLDSTLSGLAIVELTQGRPRRGGTNPGPYDSNPVGVGKKCDGYLGGRHPRKGLCGLPWYDGYLVDQSTVPSEVPKRMRRPGTRETERPEATSTMGVPAGGMVVQAWPETFLRPQTSGREGWGTISAMISE